MNTDRFDWPDGQAAISQNFSSDWKRYYEWIDSRTRKFTGKFSTVEEAIKAVPQYNKIIKVQITDEGGKDVSYTINRGEIAC